MSIMLSGLEKPTVGFYEGEYFVEKPTLCREKPIETVLGAGGEKIDSC